MDPSPTKIKQQQQRTLALSESKKPRNNWISGSYQTKRTFFRQC